MQLKKAEKGKKDLMVLQNEIANLKEKSKHDDQQQEKLSQELEQLRV
jgi:hypothetical protein